MLKALLNFSQPTNLHRYYVIQNGLHYCSVCMRTLYKICILYIICMMYRTHILYVCSHIHHMYILKRKLLPSQSVKETPAKWKNSLIYSLLIKHCSICFSSWQQKLKSGFRSYNSRVSSKFYRLFPRVFFNFAKNIHNLLIFPIHFELFC